MEIKNACFISYCHGEGPLMMRFVKEFKEALSSSIEPYLDIKAFVDHEKLSPGDRYNDALAQAICESVCMIAIVVPKYFNHDYCLKELEMMKKIEKIRVKKIGQNALNNKGLVIPIILRGEIKNLPDEDMKRHIHCCDFSKFNTSQPNINKSRLFVSEIEKIAKFIYDVYEELIKHNTIMSFDCARFRFNERDINKIKKPKITAPLSPFFGAR